MKSEELYRQLQQVAERFGIQFSEQNLSSAGIYVRGGLCKVKGRYRFIMDKKKPLAEKLEMLGECLAQLPLEEVFLKPAVREFLEKYK